MGGVAVVAVAKAGAAANMLTGAVPRKRSSRRAGQGRDSLPLGVFFFCCMLELLPIMIASPVLVLLSLDPERFLLPLHGIPCDQDIRTLNIST